MAEIKQWHRDLAKAIVEHRNYWDSMYEDVAQLIADHAPASTAPKDLIEKYRDALEMDLITKAINSEVSQTEIGLIDDIIEDSLTRFAAELQGAEVERVDTEPLRMVASSRDNEATAYPVWYIVDPRQMMALDVGLVVSMITGPFFSRESATETMNALRHRFKNPSVYCDSGHLSNDWVELYKASKAALKAGTWERQV